MSDMNKQEHDKIIDRIMKLMRLSESSNEHEAALAAEKAQALLAEHNLSMDDVKANQARDEWVEDASLIRPHKLWERLIMQAAAKLYFCGYYYVTRRKPGSKSTKVDVNVFVGAKHNVIVAEMMSAYLVTTVEKLSAQAAKAYPENERHSYRHSFRIAAAERLRVRIDEMVDKASAGQAKSSTGTNLPALRNMYQQVKEDFASFLKKKGTNLVYHKPRYGSNHSDGWVEGHRAADDISLNTQITADEAKLKLGQQKQIAGE